MRWLTWTILSTLILISTTTEAATAMPNLEIATKDSRLTATFSARALSTELNSHAKNILRSNTIKATTEEQGMLEFILNIAVNRMFKWLYNWGETPLSVRSKMMGRDNFLVGDFRVWWETTRATGRMPKWKYTPHS
ncbi:secreted RxLR effector peptide protein, putative [Phytophthora infestans T30-4]|uniref:Secreted RxLR effector peptide protein, putative n=1 Tax=Phytophthora infestans (strain T30-4) TaxID=403677 RepID=D0N108_PHYIT|nr:secreted RxLR effector peptide protein, putative [Phytophthora infestans T30-4]EEY67321.1 secreted RxLR effector peptide protein, putative [Phytophthora infestans T30-4]|eukprot:XP_002905969.1 secreted RxLR effector peptide protein, putative [Phytophthora infestans T30-4]